MPPPRRRVAALHRPADKISVSPEKQAPAKWNVASLLCGAAFFAATTLLLCAILVDFHLSSTLLMSLPLAGSGLFFVGFWVRYFLLMLIGTEGTTTDVGADGLLAHSLVLAGSNLRRNILNSMLWFSRFLASLDAEKLRYHRAILRESHGLRADAAAIIALALLVCGLLFVAIRRWKAKQGTTIAQRRRSSSRVRRVVPYDESEMSEGEDGNEDDEDEDDNDDDSDEDDDDDSDDGSAEAYNRRTANKDLCFVESRLTEAEYKRQAEDQTRQQVAALLRTPEFLEMVRQRGKDDAEFNWQKRRTKEAQKMQSR